MKMPVQMPDQSGAQPVTPPVDETAGDTGALIGLGWADALAEPSADPPLPPGRRLDGLPQ